MNYALLDIVDPKMSIRKRRSKNVDPKMSVQKCRYENVDLKKSIRKCRYKKNVAIFPKEQRRYKNAAISSSIRTNDTVTKSLWRHLWNKRRPLRKTSKRTLSFMKFIQNAEAIDEHTSTDRRIFPLFREVAISFRYTPKRHIIVRHIIVTRAVCA